MSERTELQLGDILTEEIANKIASPKIDGLNNWGSIELVEDDNMSSDPNNLKSRTYDFLDRIKIIGYQGLVASYSGAYYFTSLATIVLIAPGSVTVPANTTGFIFIDDLGVVVASTSLPGVADLLAVYTSSPDQITDLRGARLQDLNRAQIINLQNNSIGHKTGDVKFTLNPLVETGWYNCLGQSLSASEDPDLFAVFGYKYGGSGDTFYLPDPDDCTVGLASNSTELGAIVGTNEITLTLANMPEHTHSTNGGVHSHSTNGGVHDHTINQFPHDHGVFDPGHRHRMQNHRGAALNADVDDGSGAELSTQGNGNFAPTDISTTGIDVQPANVPLSINPASANVTVNSASANVTIGATGNSQPFSVKNKRVNLYMLVKR